MANNESQWTSATLGDITPIGDALDDVQGALQSASAVMGTLVEITNAIVTIVEIVSNIVGVVEDINRIAIETAIKALVLLKDELIKFIRDMTEFGAYVLPVFEAFDLTTAVRNELLNPGVVSKSSQPTDRYVQVTDPANPANSYFTRVRRSGRIPAFDYNTFIEDIAESFDDVRDRYRPIYDGTTKVSGITVAIAAKKLSLFVVLYILIMLMVKDTNDSKERMNQIAKILRITLGQAETLGRQGDTDKNEIRQVLEAIDETLKVTDIPEDFVTIFKRFLGLVRPETNTDSTGIPKISSVTLSGLSDSFVVFQTPASSSSVERYTLPTGEGVKDIVTVDPSTTRVNYSNYLTFNVSTNKSGALYATYDYSGTTYGPVYIGSGKETYEVSVPISPIGTINGIDVTHVNLVPPYVWDNSGTVTWQTPTFVRFQLIQTAKGEEPSQIDPTSELASSSGETTIPRKIIEFSAYVPRFNTLSEGGSVIRDGYRHNTEIDIEPANSSQTTAVKEYMNLSESEIDSMFPFRLRNRAPDITRFGPDFKTATVRVGVRPQVTTNSSLSGYLIVNGKLYVSDTERIGSSNSIFTFNDVDLGNSSTVLMQFISKINITVNEGRTDANPGGIETEYTIYSTPENFSVTKSGGKLGAPTIDSGNRANTDGNLGAGSPPWFNVTNEQKQLSALGSSLHGKYNQVYGKPDVTLKTPVHGSETTQETVSPAIYTIYGKKAVDASVYIVARKGRTSTMTFLKGYDYTFVLKQLATTISEDNFPNRYKGTISLTWDEKDKKGTLWKVSAYQVSRGDAEEWNDIISTLKKGTDVDQEAEFLRKKQHSSESVTKMVTVINSSSALDATPPNWLVTQSTTLFPFLGIATPLDVYLTELIDLLKASVPSGSYDGISDWLDLIKAKIAKIADIFKFIQDIIENILSMLDLGGLGFYFLGIKEANGVDGFKQRIRKVPVDSELAEAKYVTGFQLFVPGEAGSALMDLFNDLPSEGQDNVKVPEDKSLLDALKEIGAEAEATFEGKINDIKAMGGQISATADEIKHASWRAQEI